MASPRPSSGIGATAMAAGASASAARRAEKRRAAASARSRVGLRLKVRAPSGAGPNARKASPSPGRVGVQPQRRGRRVVAREAAGRAGGVGLGLGERADQPLDLGARHRAGRSSRGGPSSSATTVDSRPIAARSAVEGDSRGGAGLGDGVGERGRARAAGAVGRRRDDRAAERGEHRLRHRMGRRADGDGVEAGAGEIADQVAVADRRDDGQRPRPERLGQAPGARRPAARRAPPSPRSATWAISGLKRGRPLAS